MKKFNEFLIESLEDQIKDLEAFQKRILEIINQNPEAAARLGEKFDIKFKDYPLTLSTGPVKPQQKSGIRTRGIFNTPNEGGRTIELFHGKPLNQVFNDPDMLETLRHEAAHAGQHEYQIRDTLEAQKGGQTVSRTGVRGSLTPEQIELIRSGMGQEKFDKWYKKQFAGLDPVSLSSMEDFKSTYFPTVRSRQPNLSPMADESAVKRAAYVGTDIELNARLAERSKKVQDFYRNMLKDTLERGNVTDPADVQNAKNLARSYALPFMTEPEYYEASKTMRGVTNLPSHLYRVQTPPSWMAAFPKLYNMVYSKMQKGDVTMSFPFQPPEAVDLSQSSISARNEKIMDRLSANERKAQKAGARAMQMVDPDLSTPEKIAEFKASVPEPPKTQGDFSGTNYTKPVWARGLDVASKVGSLLDPVGTAVETGVGRSMGRLAGGAAGMYGLADMVFGKEAFAPSTMTDAEREMWREGEERERRRRAREVSDIIGRGYDPYSKTPWRQE